MAKKQKKKGKQKPPVSLEEIPSGARPIEGVGTSIAAFIGVAPVSPFRLVRTAVLVAAVVGVVRSRITD